MALQVINVGTAPNDGTGDAIRTAYIKCNDNFSELYSRAQTTPPATLVGTVGDQAGMYAYDENFWYYCFADYDSSSIIWSQVAQIGNINVSGIQSGNSDAEFDNINGNLVITIGGTSNVAVFKSTGLEVTSNISAARITTTANIQGGNIVTAGQVTATGNVSGGNLNVTGNIVDTGALRVVTGASGNITLAPNGSNVVVVTTTGANITGTVSASGNVTGGNVVATTSILTPGIVSATGNIVTDGYFVGTFFGNITGNFTIPGGNTQVIYNTAGNADASANFTFNDATNVLQVIGNVSTGNVIATTASVAGNVTGGNVVSVAAVSAGGNVTGGNLVTSGIVSATGNIASSANVNGANINATSGISASGNVTGGNVNGGTVNAVSNITGSNITVVTATVSGNAAIGNISSAGLISITGNISAGNLNITGNIVDTDALRIVTGSSGNITLSPNGSNTVVITTTGANITGTVSASGNVTGANLITGGLITATGNITSSANVAGGNVIAVSAVNASSVSASGNINGGNIIAASAVNSSTVSASGNINGGNIIAASAVNSSTVSASGNITGGNLSVGTGSITTGSIVNANANGVGNIGSATGYFNTVFAQATSAQYADLAEKYIADQNYIPGTVIVIGGSQEVTAANQDHDSAVVGVVSTNPAYTMNSGLEHENVVTVALIGRVPCLVQGPVRRGDLLVTATQGRARSEPNPRVGCVVGKALEDFEGAQGTIEVIVGKL